LFLIKNNIYRSRFKNLKLIFVLENAYDADDRIQCLDMDTYDVIYFSAFELWGDILDTEEIDGYYLQCSLPVNFYELQEERIDSYAPLFSDSVDYYLKSDKNMRDRDLALSDIDGMFLSALDEIINSNPWDYSFVEVKALRLAHSLARNTVWQNGAIIL